MLDLADKTLTQAEERMRLRRFSDAIPLFEQYLEASPGDLKALLRLGICHLLDRSEEVFRSIYHRAEELIQQMKSIPEDIGHLWQQYRALFLKISATPLILGVVALSSCSEQQSAHKYSGGVYKKAEPAKTEEVTDKEQTPQAEEPKEEAKPPVTSSHRYSGGVYRPPKPQSE